MKKILIIDDNKDDRLLIEIRLKKAGINCMILPAPTGEEGIRIAEESKPDIVIIDTNLPKQNGFQACRKIRTELGNSVKIIMMTGYVDAVDAVEARRSGADEYSIKTSDAGNIVTKVANFLSYD